MEWILVGLKNIEHVFAPFRPLRYRFPLPLSKIGHPGRIFPLSQKIGKIPGFHRLVGRQWEARRVRHPAQKYSSLPAPEIHSGQSHPPYFGMFIQLHILHCPLSCRAIWMIAPGPIQLRGAEERLIDMWMPILRPSITTTEKDVSYYFFFTNLYFMRRIRNNNWRKSAKLYVSVEIFNSCSFLSDNWWLGGVG